jgi:type II secretion system protein G
MMRFLRKDKGFTLLEVMLVVIIIGIIAVIALPKLLVTKAEAEDDSCDSNVQAIRTQMEQFNWDVGHYPNCSALSDFLDVANNTEYAKYWPETSTVSATCPGSGTYRWGVGTGIVACSEHSN